MGKDTKGDRKSTKPSSSARAAEVLANKAAGAGGFGFGGFVGSNLITPNVPGFGFGAAGAARIAASAAAATSDSAAAGAVQYGSGAGDGDVPVTVDSELAQCLRHLSKKDPITKTKALQNLRALIPSRTTPDLITALPPWIYIYRRLILDPSRAVRSETAATFACLLGALGKSLAPHLRALMGPWYLAMHDPYGDAAGTSRTAFTSAFPAVRRQTDVLLYCRTELMAFLRDHLAATPQQLGDARKDSPEELEERHQRVQAACLTAIASLITCTTAPPPADAVPEDERAAATTAASKDQLLAAVRDVLSRPGFWKSTAGSKSALVRRASYGLACVAAARGGDARLLEDCAAEAAGCVLGALGDKEATNHGAMCEAVLAYSKFCPDAWRHINLRKALLPRLYSLLRHGCYGSATASLRALLPLLAALPAGALGPEPDVLVAVLEALWSGMQDTNCVGRPAKLASLSAYRECLTWGLTNSARLATTTTAVAPASKASDPAKDDGHSDGAAARYCRTLLSGSLAHHVLPAALRSGSAAESAAGMVVELVQSLAGAADKAVTAVAGTTATAAVGFIPFHSLTDVTCEFVRKSLTDAVTGHAADDLATLCDGTAELLARLRRCATAAGTTEAYTQQVAAAAARGLVSESGGAGLPAAAAQLLATLLREYGTGLATALMVSSAPSSSLMAAGDDGAGRASFSFDAQVASYCSGPSEGPAAEAAADLLVALCLSRHNQDGPQPTSVDVAEEAAGAASITSTPELWERVIKSVIGCEGTDATVGSTTEYEQLRDEHETSQCLRRAVLLLRRYAASVAAAAVTVRSSSTTTAATWTSTTLDDLAVRLAVSMCHISSPSSYNNSVVQLLSTTLGGNAGGRVLLTPAAAQEVLVALTKHLTVAASSAGTTVGTAAAGACAMASECALAAVREPLADGRCELWPLLSEEVCGVLAATAQLSWWAARVPYIRTGDYGGGGDDASSSSDVGSGGDTDSECGHFEDMSGSEEDEADNTHSEHDDGEHGDGAGVLSAVAGARHTAYCWWREARPLSAAAAALPPSRTDALVRHIASLLAAVVPTSSSEHGAASTAASAMTPRAWATHAAQLLAAVPGDVVQRGAVLDILLAAQPEWRVWSSFTAGPSTSAAEPRYECRTSLRPEPVLEYLARLAETVGPRTVLRLSYDMNTSTAFVRGTTSASSSGRCWVLLELLCGHHAAEAMDSETAVAAAKEEEEEGEEEEGTEEGEDGNGGSGAGKLTAAWRRVVRRSAEVLLTHVVAGAVREEMESSSADGESPSYDSGVYGALLRDLVDELAEGCRGGGAVAESALALSAPLVDPDEELPRVQAVFLTALWHVMSSIERTASLHTDQYDDADGSGTARRTPPLLSHQQRFCRHWLATTRPATATSAGLPPQALLRLLPLVAGPVRQAAAAAATVASHGGGAAAEAIVAASGLPELSCAWVRHCLSRPAVLVEPCGPAVAALALATACFPVPYTRDGKASGGSGCTLAAAALALARSGGAGLAEVERPLLMQLVRHQLVRHAGHAAARRQASDIGPSPTSASTSATTCATCATTFTSPAAAAAVTRLAHSAVVYHWRGLGQPDWHALLQEVQSHLAEAVAALQSALHSLAAAARHTADVILRHSAGTTPPGPMALQLLRQLGQRGVLGRLPAGAELAVAAEGALEGCGIGAAAQAGAQLAAVLVDLRDEVAAAGGGGTVIGSAAASREYDSTVSSCTCHIMQLAIALGGVECYGRAFGPSASAAVASWLVRHRAFWTAVTRCAGRALVPGHEQLGCTAAAVAVTAQAATLESVGLDPAGALLSVALTDGSHVLQPVAYRLLLSGALLSRITLADAVGSGASDGKGGDSGGEPPELPEYDGDDVSYLVAGGIRPEMAHWLRPLPPSSEAAAAGSRRVYLTAWALLLAHALDLDPGSRGLVVLQSLLREAGHLVHGLLGQIVPELGLQKQPGGSGGMKGGGRGRGNASGDASTAASTSAASASTDGWHLAEALREIGLPYGHHAVRTTCRTLYRAVLRALPATARTWFGDLRDRGLAAAVESYTAAAEGPALLAAEMSAVQALSRRPAADDESKFTVRASAALREVVAVLEVEDGAVLELVVRLPACMPLRAPEVECRRKVGVNDTRLRKWLLSISTFLRHQNGSVADAIGLWRRNVDSEFAGVEPCLICYSVISSVNAQLPRLVCRTCSVRFHPACLYKWFKSAGKSQCPHCQALW